MTMMAQAQAILERLVAFPTVSRDSNLDLVAYVADFLKGCGLEPVIVPDESGQKAAIYAHAGPSGPGGVVLSGHSDVVPVDGQDWTSDPFRLTLRDGRLIGRGTCDMKGFVALSLAAMAQAARRPLARPLQNAVSYDEEVGCTGAPPMIAHMAAHGMPRASCVIVGEPSMMQVVTGHKGGQGFVIHVRGYEVHSSLLPKGVSAVMEAARLIGWVNAMNARNAAGVPGVLAEAFDPPWTTLHVGTIAGGTATNITARDCRMMMEIRTVPGEAIADWRAALLEEAARLTAAMQAVHPASGITVTLRSEVPALAPEVGGPAEALARRLTGDNATHVVGYGTEAGQFQEAGYSAVVCGPGDIAQAHQADEYLTLDQFAKGAGFMERLLDELSA